MTRIRPFASFKQQWRTLQLILSINSTEWSASRKANRSSVSQEICCILWNPKVHYRIHKRPLPAPSWAKSIQSMPLHPRLVSYQKISPVTGPCEMVPNVVCFYGEHLIYPLSWRTTSCRLSATAYSIYSQPSLISGSRSSSCKQRTSHGVVTEK